MPDCSGARKDENLSGIHSELDSESSEGAVRLNSGFRRNGKKTIFVAMTVLNPAGH